MSENTYFFKENIIKEDISHITVGDPQFETLGGPLSSRFAPDLARRCSVDVKDCGEFFVNCNLVTGNVKVCATYYPPSNEPGSVINVPLDESEKKCLLQALENHCRKHYKRDAIYVLNDQRSFIGLSFVKPRKPELQDQIAEAEQISHSFTKNADIVAGKQNKQER